MILCGYENYTIFNISHNFWGSRGNGWTPDFISHYLFSYDNIKYIRTTEGSSILLGLRSHQDHKELKELPFIKQKIYQPKPGDTLYFDKHCTIPRIKIDGIYKRTINLAKSDVVVVPEFTSFPIDKDTYVFKDDERKFIFIAAHPHKVVAEPELGESLREIISDNMCFISKEALYGENSKKVSGDKLYEESLKPSIRNALDAKCFYRGALIGFKENQRFFFDIIDGIYPKIIPETDLIKLLGKEEDAFTPETVDDLIAGLHSSDREVVSMNLRVLASMDYIHYPSITRYILGQSESSWRNVSPFNSSVKFMLKTLNYQYYNGRNPWKQVTAEEFALAQGIFESCIERELLNCISNLTSRTNIKCDITYNIATSLPAPAISTKVEETDNEEYES